MSISSPDSYISDSPNIGTQMSPESDLDLSLHSMYMMHGFVPETCPESQICSVPWSETQVSDNLSPTTTPFITSEPRVSPQKSDDLMLGILIPGYKEMIMRERVGRTGDGLEVALVDGPVGGKSQVSDNLSPTNTPFISSNEEIKQRLYGPGVSAQEIHDQMLGILLPGYTETMMRRRAARAGDVPEVAPGD